MKTHPQTHGASKSALVRFLPAAAVAIGCSVPPAVARTDAQGDAKAYTLFMGADISVGVKNEICPVWDVSGNSFVIKVGGQPVVVSTKDGSVTLKITPGLKITESSALISSLKTEPTYSPWSDPYTKFTRQTDQAASDYAQSQFAANYGNALMDRVTALTSDINGPGGAPLVAGQISQSGQSAGSNGPGAAAAAAASTSSSNAQRSLDNVSQISNSANAALESTPALVYGTGTHPDAEMFDAMDVTFEVSATKPLEHPYVVLIGRYSEKGSPTGMLRTWVYAEALSRIDSKASKVQINRSGFPPGFVMKSFQLHLYNDGQEVATNVASNRVELTRGEAFEYVKMEYVSSHKDATLPAVPAMGKLPADLPTRLAQGQFSQAFYVRVSKDGVGQEAFLDETCTRRVEDPYVESVVKAIRFKPALQNGRPVDGVAVVKLGELMM